VGKTPDLRRAADRLRGGPDALSGARPDVEGARPSDRDFFEYMNEYPEFRDSLKAIGYPRSQFCLPLRRLTGRSRWSAPKESPQTAEATLATIARYSSSGRSGDTDVTSLVLGRRWHHPAKQQLPQGGAPRLRGSVMGQQGVQLRVVCRAESDRSNRPRIEAQY
jgi:hypothetical protein